MPHNITLISGDGIGPEITGYFKETLFMTHNITLIPGDGIGLEIADILRRLYL